MLKNIPKILWAAVAALSLVLAGVLGTSPANSLSISANFYRDVDNCNSGTLVLQGIPGSTEVDAVINWTKDSFGTSDEYLGSGGTADSWRHFYNPGDDYKYFPEGEFTMRVLVFYPETSDPILDEQVPVAACGVSIPDSDGDGVTDEKDNCPNTPAGTTVDANGCPVVEPTPNPTVSVTPTGTPTVEPTVVPTPTVTPTQPAPQPQAVKGLKVKVKKAKVKATWKSATATKWQCKTKVVKGKAKAKPKKRTVTSAQCTFKVKVKTKKAKVKISVREIGGPYKTKTVKLSA